MKIGNFKAKFGSQIGDSINACSISETKSIFSEITNRYKYNLIIDNKFCCKG